MKKYLIFLLLIILSVGSLYFLIVNAPSSAVKDLPVPTPTIPHLDSMKIYNLINDYRASKGLNKLVFDPKLCPLAKERLEQVHSDWSHNKFKETRYKYFSYGYVGENLNNGYYSDQASVDAWIASPSHLKNIVDTEFISTCIETDYFNKKTYAVQIFSNF